MNQSKRTWMIGTGLIIFGVGSMTFSVHDVLIAVLNAVIFIELYRMLWEFALKNEARIKIRYAIDFAFVFCVRELYLAWILLKEDQTQGEYLIKWYLISMAILLLFRYIASKFSPSHTERREIDFKHK